MAFAGILFATLGCLKPPELQSNLRPGYSRPMERVAIAILGSRAEDAPFFNGLGSALISGLQARQVQSEMKFFTTPVTQAPSTLPDPDLRAFADRLGFRPAFLLRISLASLGQESNNLKAAVNVVVSEYPAGTEVWKGRLDFRWMPGLPNFRVFPPPIGADPVTCAEPILRRLEADGLLPPVR